MFYFASRHFSLELLSLESLRVRDFYEALWVIVIVIKTDHRIIGQFRLEGSHLFVK